MPTSTTPSRTGFLGRIGWQSRQTPTPSPVVPKTVPEEYHKSDTDVSTVLSENAKLKAELKKLRRRCEDFKFQSEMNQEIMQEGVAASKRDVDHLSADNERLKKRHDDLLSTSTADIDALNDQLASAATTSQALTATNKNLRHRCEELTTQSQADKDMLRINSADLASKTAEVRVLEGKLQSFESSQPNDIVAKDAEIATYKQTISSLQTSLTSLQENYMRLTAMGCIPTSSSNNMDLERRISTLEFENSQLQKTLDDRIADTKSRILDYASELNDLSDQIRNSEADAAQYSSELKMRTSQFLTLKAEFDAIFSELHTSRRASKRLTTQLLSCSLTSAHRHADPELISINEALMEQLAALQATSLEREKLIEKFKEQYEVLARAVKREQGEKEELGRRVEEAWRENRGDRERFEGVVRRRDGRIRELERRERERERERGRKDSKVGRSGSRVGKKDGGGP